jgi:HTH-type transcriptional regulator/antitoxin HigA
MIMKIKIQPIHNKEDYEKALTVIDRLWDAKTNTEEGDILDILVTLVEAYENKHYSMLPPDPIEAIKFRMGQMGLEKSDIVSILGGGNRVSEIFHRKRKLSLKMIRNLHDKLNIPFESLVPV